MRLIVSMMKNQSNNRMIMMINRQIYNMKKNIMITNNIKTIQTYLLLSTITVIDDIVRFAPDHH
jgi:hypothetical protein